MKSETIKFSFKKTQWILPIFEWLVRYKVNLKIGGIMRLSHIYLTVSKVYFV
jgi:hypothetical protein